MAKKIILYGSAACPDCVALKKRLDREGIRYGYVDVLASLGHLKKFLNLRDANPESFRETAASGKIGIPAIVMDDREIHVESCAIMEKQMGE